MKNKNIIMALALWAFIGCEKDSMQQFSNIKSQVKNASTVVENASQVESKLEKAEERTEVLKKLIPFDHDKFKAWLPDEIDGMQRTNYDFITVIGSQGTAKYSDESGEKILDFTINDCAGEQGVAMYMTQTTIGGLYGNFASENDTKKEGIVERNGIPSLETYYKDKNESSIRTIIEDRYIINATGTQMNTDELYAIIQKLHIENLN